MFVLKLEFLVVIIVMFLPFFHLKKNILNKVKKGETKMNSWHRCTKEFVHDFTVTCVVFLNLSRNIYGDGNLWLRVGY